MAAALGIGGLVSLARLRVPAPTDAPPLLAECPAPGTALKDGPEQPTVSNGSRVPGPDATLSRLARGVTPPVT